MAKVSEKELAEIIDLRRSGIAYVTIANKYNLTGERVRQIIRKYNETAADPVNATALHRLSSGEVAKRRENVAKLRKSGKKLKDIAEELGISLYIVIQDIRNAQKNGILEK